MNFKISIIILIIFSIAMCKPNCHQVMVNASLSTNVKKIPNIQIILSSTRKGRISDKIGSALKHMADKRQNVSAQIVDLRDYSLPFLNDEESPASRKQISDPAVKKWSDKIKEADAFIIVSPEYNAGYPGVLKNALDSLYIEWHNKPVGFVGYSGGSSGGANAINQLRQVVMELKMKPVSLDIKIPSSSKALDKEGNFIDKTIENKLNSIIDQLIS